MFDVLSLTTSWNLIWGRPPRIATRTKIFPLKIFVSIASYLSTYHPPSWRENRQLREKKSGPVTATCRPLLILQAPPPIQENPRFIFKPTMIKDSPFPPVHADFPRMSMSSGSRMKRLQLLIQISCRKRGTFPGLIYVFVILPTNFLLISQFHAMMDECTIEADTHESNDHSIDTSLHSGPLRVPTFYSYSGYSLGGFVLGICVSVLFGAMHCIAWHYEFPSSPERWGWRLSSIIMSVVPLNILSVFMVSQWMGTTTRLPTRGLPIFHIFYVGFAWPYVIVLLLFPFIALRALPPGAHTELYLSPETADLLGTAQ